MTLMEDSLSGILDDHTPLWKHVTKVKTLKGEEEIGEHSMNHSQGQGPSHVDKRIRTKDVCND